MTVICINHSLQTEFSMLNFWLLARSFGNSGVVHAVVVIPDYLGRRLLANPGRGQRMPRSFLCLSWYLWVAAVWLSILLVSPAVHAQEASIPRPPPPNVASEETAAADPVPAMFAHPETDRWWISGQAHWISQWHPAFHSPYEGPRSLSPQAQDATSRVLTLFTGVRLTNTNELICDVQETGGHGIGEAVGLAGVTNLDIVRNPDLSKAPYIARLMWHHIIPLSDKKIDSSRSPLSLFSSLPERRIEVRFGKFSIVDFFDTNTYGTDTTFQYGKTWTPIVAADSGVRGYAHVIKEDTVSPSLLFLGTEFGLWISLDSGKHWAQYKGHEFPNVAVRDIAVHARESDLVLATHGRGIWIIDDITPLRKLTPEFMAQEATFLQAKPAQQRLVSNGGWVEGNAAFTGPNPPDAALITYYQKKRHIFGKMKLEIFDPQGKLVDTLPPNSRRGISRVEWPIRLKAPHVPPAATLAFEAAQGPRVLPGTYTVKMTRGKETYATELVVELDPRAKFTLEERKQEFDAAMRVYNLLGDMSFQVDRINGVHDALLGGAAKLKGGAVLGKRLQDLAEKVEAMRKKIVATKEGGAVTGEERIREKTTELYGAILIYEGRPADYQVARIDSLKKELEDVAGEFDSLVAKELTSVNKMLLQKKLEPIQVIGRKAWDTASADSGGAAPVRGRLFFERD